MLTFKIINLCIFMSLLAVLAGANPVPDEESDQAADILNIFSDPRDIIPQMKRSFQSGFGYIQKKVPDMLPLKVKNHLQDGIDYVRIKMPNDILRQVKKTMQKGLDSVKKLPEILPQVKQTMQKRWPGMLPKVARSLQNGLHTVKKLPGIIKVLSKKLHVDQLIKGVKKHLRNYVMGNKKNKY